jgi:uncharacterized glyoxalase superfamily protein PhnB/predicted enzyme related to lactoylglutathione lyase
MTDAFDALRADTSPVAPPSEFGARLRARLADTPSLSRTEPPMPITITPYLVVDGAAAAIDFYVAAFGALEHHRLVGDDGRVGHAELVLGDSRIMLADEYPDVGAISPTTRGGSSTSFTLAVPDVDAVFARALSLGATEVRPVADQFYGHRQGTLRDPFGHQWSVSSPIAEFDDATYASNSHEAGFEWQQGAAAVGEHDHQVKHHERGDLYYFTLPTADLVRAKAFFSAVLGWQFDDAESGHASNISAPPGGLHVGQTTSDLWFVVDDIEAAVAQVRSLGGTSTEPVHYDSGWAAECTDDQGTRFCLSVPADKYTR